ncbi:MAG: bifunctional metallophosphatase/5'-nucleotidase [Oscillibacter sp.]|nr:bifunctional metallophosphatase/5'-nucleotidase [Oscillibacter sp.]
MTIKRTARRLAALALTLGAVWLWGVRASADSSNYADNGTGALVRELPDVLKVHSGAVGEGREAGYHGKTVILHTNDTYGVTEGFPRVAWLKREFERMGAETILADSGNFSMGSVYQSSKGAAALELMNLTGYDVAALGRYDWNYGYEILKRNLRRAAFPILCANATENGEAAFTPNYTYTTRSGVTVGFFGLITPKAVNNLDSSTRKITIDKRGEVYRRVQEQLDALCLEGDVIPAADVVISLSALGDDLDYSDAEYNSLDLFQHFNARGLDMVLDGLSPTVMTAGPNGEQVQSCGDSFAYIGVIVIDDASKAIEDHYLIPTAELDDDPEVLEAVEKLQNRYKVEFGAVFARTETDLNGEKAPGNRTEETNLGDLISDAMIWTARKELKNPLVDADHFIGLTNGAAIRASILEGSITQNHISAAFPFSNTVSVVYVTGAELLEVLEACTWCIPDAYSNSYPQSSGIAFTLDTRIPYDAGDAYPDSDVIRPASVRRVRINSVNGKPFDPDALYAVATNNYCAGGSDAFYILGTAKERYDSATSIEESITDYIRRGLGGVVTEAMYGEPRGDHTILT